MRTNTKKENSKADSAVNHKFTEFGFSIEKKRCVRSEIYVGCI